MKWFVNFAFGFLLALSCSGEAKKTDHVDFTVTIRNDAGVAVSHGVATLDGTVFNFSFGSPYNASSAGIYGPTANGEVLFDNLGWVISPPQGTFYLGGFYLTRSQMSQVKAGLWYVFEKSADGKIVACGQIEPVR
jgi:hypothetical protein